MKYIVKYYIICLLIVLNLLIHFNLNSTESLNILTLNKPAPGYINFSNSLGNNSSFALYDNYGLLKYFGNAPRGGLQKLLGNGQWIMISPDPNTLYLYNKQLQLIDSINLGFANDTLIIDNHDFLSLPNNRFLIAMTKTKIMDLSVIIDGGQTEARVMGQVFFEVDKNGNIYWSWDSFEHFDITEATNDIDLTQMVIDFTHFNSYVVDTDNNIIVSMRNLDQIFKIDKSNGNFIWRMGGYASKINEFRFVNDTINGFFGFSHQHSIQLLSNGNMLIYDNGKLKQNFYSRAVEYQLNQSGKIATKVWEYRHTPDISAENMGNVQRLENGNTFINWGIQYATEVKPNKTIALEFPISSFYRIEKHVIKMDALTKFISGSGIYSFTNANYNTNVKLNINSLTGRGNTWVEKHYYSPTSLNFSSNDYTSILPYRWVLSSDSVAALNGKVLINIDGFSGFNNPNKITIYKRNQENSGSFSSLNTTYNAVSKELYADFSNFGEFIICSNELGIPTLNIPVDYSIGIGIYDRLVWNKLTGALKYRIQISEDYTFSTIVQDTIIVSDTSYNYSELEYYKTYYWRVRAMNSKDTSQWSNIRNFKTKISKPILIKPANNKFAVQLKDTLIWQDFGIPAVYNLQIAKDENFDNLVENKNNLNQAFFVSNLLEYNNRYFWRVKVIKDGDTSDWSPFSTYMTLMQKPILSIPKKDSINLPSMLTLYWNDVDGADGYIIDITTNKDFQVSETKRYQSFLSNIEIDSLKNRTNYLWRVKAIRSTDSSDFSDVFNFKTLLEKPLLISPVNDSTSLSPVYKFEWQPQDSIDDYFIQIAKDTLFKNIFVEHTIIDSNYLIIKLLPEFTKLFWRLRSRAGNSISEWSEIRKFTTKKGAPLQSPNLFSPTNNSTAQSVNANFDWETSDRAISYRIQVSKDPEFNTIVQDSTNIFINSCKYLNFAYDTKYYWRVKAYNSYDSSYWSTIWSFRTRVKPTLNTVELIKPRFDELNVLVHDTLIWEDVKLFFNYQLQVFDDSLLSNLVISEEDLTDNFFVYDLDKNKEFYWRVRYLTEADTSDWSDTWEFRTETGNALSTPKLNNITQNNVAVPVEGILNWDEVENATTYKVSISKNQKFYPRVINVSWHKDTKLNYSGLEYNTIYYWRVAGQNDNAVSHWSETTELLTELSKSNLLTPINNAKNIDIHGLFKWGEVEGALKYNIQVSVDSLFEEIIVEDSTTLKCEYPYNLQSLTTYFWRIKAQNDMNFGSWSEIYRFTTNNSISVEDETYSEINLYPNPSDLSLYVENIPLDIIKIQIHNVLGQLIKVIEIKTSTDNVLISTIDFPAGYYYLQLLGKSKLINKPFAVVK